MEEEREAGSPRRTLRWLVLGLVVAVALIAWAATRGDDGGDEASTGSAPLEAQIVSEEELAEIAADRGHDVYWAGPIEGKELEASEIGGGGIQVTYVEEGAEPGGDKARQPTIGSYPVGDPAKALANLARAERAIVRRTGDGGIVVSNAAAPNSVYFAAPDGSVQVEVYHPVPRLAMALARSGAVGPVG